MHGFNAWLHGRLHVQSRMRGLVAVSFGLVAVLALLEACDARHASVKQGLLQSTESLREDITNPKVCDSRGFLPNRKCVSYVRMHIR